MTTDPTAKPTEIPADEYNSADIAREKHRREAAEEYRREPKPEPPEPRVIEGVLSNQLEPDRFDELVKPNAVALCFRLRMGEEFFTDAGNRRVNWRDHRGSLKWYGREISELVGRLDLVECVDRSARTEAELARFPSLEVRLTETGARVADEELARRVYSAAKRCGLVPQDNAGRSAERGDCAAFVLTPEQIHAIYIELRSDPRQEELGGEG